MTVKDLIQRLQQEDPNMEVVTDLHSEYALVESVRRIEAYDAGGYISACYRSQDPIATNLAKSRMHGYVYIGETL